MNFKMKISYKKNPSKPKISKIIFKITKTVDWVPQAHKSKAFSTTTPIFKTKEFPSLTSQLAI